MDSLTNTFKRQLHERGTLLGLWFGLANNIAAEICAQSDFDWLLIDAEHSPLSDKDVLSCLQAVAPYKVSPLVRPMSGDKNVLKRLCDVGVQSFLVPMIDTAEQARDVVSSVSGPSDLGAALGYPGQPNHPDVVATVSKALEDICGAGKPAGVLAVASTLVDTYKKAGASFIGVGSDCGVLAKGIQRLYESFTSGEGAQGDY